MKPGRKMLGYRCVSCGHEVDAAGLHYTCDACGANLDAVFDHAHLAKNWSRGALSRDADPSLWRWLPLLPVAEAPAALGLRVGGTPLVPLERMAQRFGLERLVVKDDTRLPSGSLKDRASEVGIRHAVELGRDVIVAASTGNAAASLACLTAYHRLEAVILAPASAPPAKLTQILQHGARLVPVDGSYDKAFDLSLQVAERQDWYCRSTGINPVLSEGKKTVALEIAEQSGWDVPDVVFVPVGDGCIIGGVHKGFADLHALGWIERMPRLVAVQAEGSSAVVDALERGGGVTAVRARTLADSISVDLPRDGAKAVRAVRESGGFGLRVSDEAILDAQHDLAREAGIFAEPAAAAAWAGLMRAADEGRLDDVASAAVLATGTGLKDVDAARRRVEIPASVRADARAVEAALREVTS